MARPSSSLAAQIRDLLPNLREISGEGRMSLSFDRGGWSPELFAGIIDAGFDLLTYRKLHRQGDPRPRWRVRRGDLDRGRRPHPQYDLADTDLTIRSRRGAQGPRAEVAAGHPPRPGSQVHILTTRPRAGPDGCPPPPSPTGWEPVAGGNYFRYGRDYFALDAPDCYAVTPDDPDRMVPNPAKKTASAPVKTARNPRRRSRRPGGETRRAAQPRPRHHRHHHQPGSRPARTPVQPPAASWTPPGQQPTRCPRKSRSPSTTPPW